MHTNERNPADGPEEEDMPATERDLAEDAPWKRIQKNTFTRWCNEHLKKANKNINDLETDLSDGLRLIALIEVLSHKRIPRYNKRPTFRAMKLENVSAALQFLEDEHIKIVNIDSSDIVNGKLKLILGLIWTLILHYSISMPMWEGDDEPAVKQTPKEKLLGFVQAKVPDLPVKNFNKDWNDGKACGALVDACAPGLCPDWEDWNPNDKVKNCEEAMDLADKWLGVPKLLSPEDMASPHVDDLSVMTYVSQFPQAKLKPGAPLRPKTNPNKAPAAPRAQPNKVRVFGKGVEATGNQVGSPAPFTIDTFSAGGGDIKVSVENPRGKQEQFKLEENLNKAKTYTCTYTPTMEGTYVVKVIFAGKEVPKSPFKVGVAASKSDPSKCSAKGPGLESAGVVANKATYFDIFTAGAGPGAVNVVIADPDGKTNTVPVEMEQTGDGQFRCTYKPLKMGIHTITVTFDGSNIPKSPFKVNVAMPKEDPASTTGTLIDFGDDSPTKGSTQKKETPPSFSSPGLLDDGGSLDTKSPSDPLSNQQALKPDSSQDLLGFDSEEEDEDAVNAAACRAYGRGIQARGVRAKEVADFRVVTKAAGQGELKVSVIGPGGMEMPVKVSDQGDGNYACQYRPGKPGVYKVNITFSGQHIPKSPFTVNVGSEAKPSRIRAYGPGLEGGQVGHPAEFVVETAGEDISGLGGYEATKGLGFSIEGPSQAKIECHDNGDGSCDVVYWPTEAGEYAVHIVTDDEDIANSPYMAQIRPQDKKFTPGQVKAYGPGLEKTGIVVGRTMEFTVDAKKVPAGQLQIWAYDQEAEKMDVKVRDNGNKTYTCTYTPTKAIRYTIDISWDQVNIPNSPFRVHVAEGSYPNKVRVYGPGVEKTGLKSGKPTQFTVDCTEAGSGDVSIGIKCSPGVVGEREADIDFDIVKNDNDTFTVSYVPPAAGRYTIMVMFGEQEIPKSPFTIQVESAGDASKVKAEGPGLEPTGVVSGKPTYFTVNTRGAGEGKLDLDFVGPSRGGGAKDVNIVDNKDETFTVHYTPVAAGPMNVSVNYAGKPIPKSPFKVNVAPPVDLSKVKVDGLGEKVIVNQEKEFVVHTRGAGGLGVVEITIVSVTTKKVLKTTRVEKRGDDYVCVFTALEVGMYAVNVMYDGLVVDGSPFGFEAVPGANPGKVKAYGPGLKGGKVNREQTFTIDTREAGQGGLGLTIEGPSESRIECKDRGDGTCSVSYWPEDVGEYSINVMFADQHIPGSPFPARVVPAHDASKVKAKGPGLSPGNKAGDPCEFTVDIREAGEAELTIEVITETGERVDVKIEETHEGTFRIQYVPQIAGSYTITIKYGGDPIPQVPIRITIEQKVDVSGIRCYGPGVEGMFVDAPTEFTIDAKSVSRRGGDNVRCVVQNPSGAKTEAAVKDNRDGTYTASYTPFEEGRHLIDVLYEELQVPGAPFKVQATEGCDPSKVRAYGPGLEGGLTDKPQQFTIETKGAGTGGLGLAIEGPSEAKMTCKDNKDGSCTVEYFPTTPGDYDIHISYGEQPIRGSPFSVLIKDDIDVSKVKAYGPGLEKTGVRAQNMQVFTVDHTKTGSAPLDVKVTSQMGATVNTEVTDNHDGTHTVKYIPPSEGACKVDVKYDNQSIPQSPFNVRVEPPYDASKVKATGPGLQQGVPASFPISFTIDCRDAGNADLEVILEDPDGRMKSPEIHDNGDGTYTITYTPEQSGNYTIEIKYGGEQVPRSPFRITVKPTGDANKCSVTVRISPPGRVGQGQWIGDGMQPYIQIGEETCVTVNCKTAGKGKVNCTIQDANGEDVDVDVVENDDGTFDIFYTAQQQGEYTITIRFGGQHIQGSPYKVQAVDDLAKIPNGTFQQQYMEQQSSSFAYSSSTSMMVEESQQHAERLHSAVYKTVDLLSEAESQLQTTNERLSSLQKEHDDLLDQNSKLHRLYHDKLTEVEQLNSDLVEVRGMAEINSAKLQSNISILNEEVEALKSKHKIQEGQLRDRESEIEELRRRIRELEAENEALRRKIADLRRELDDQTANMERYQREARDANSEVERLEQLLAQRESDIRGLQSDLLSARDEVNITKMKTTEITRAESEQLSSQMKLSNDLQMALNEKQGRLGAMEAEARKLRSDLEISRRDNEEKFAEINGLKNKTRDMESELSGLNQKLYQDKQANRSLQEKLDDLQFEMNRLRRELQEKEGYITSMETKMSNLESSVVGQSSEKDGKIQEQMEEIRRLRMKIESLNDDMTERERKMLDLAREKEELQGQYEFYYSETSKLQTQVTEIQTVQTQMGGSTEALEDELESLRRRLKSDNEHANQEAFELHRRITELELERNTATEKLKHMEVNMSQGSGEVEKLRQQLRRAEQDSSNTELRYNEMHKVNERLRGDMDDILHQRDIAQRLSKEQEAKLLSLSQRLRHLEEQTRTEILDLQSKLRNLQNEYQLLDRKQQDTLDKLRVAESELQTERTARQSGEFSQTTVSKTTVTKTSAADQEVVKAAPAQMQQSAPTPRAEALELKLKQLEADALKMAEEMDSKLRGGQPDDDHDGPDGMERVGEEKLGRKPKGQGKPRRSGSHTSSSSSSSSSSDSEDEGKSSKKKHPKKKDGEKDKDHPKKKKGVNSDEEEPKKKGVDFGALLADAKYRPDKVERITAVPGDEMMSVPNEAKSRPDDEKSRPRWQEDAKAAPGDEPFFASPADAARQPWGKQGVVPAEEMQSRPDELRARPWRKGVPEDVTKSGPDDTNAQPRKKWGTPGNADDDDDIRPYKRGPDKATPGAQEEMMMADEMEAGAPGRMRPVEFVVPIFIEVLSSGNLTAEVKQPSGRIAQPKFIDNRDGSLTIKYTPTEAGLHELGIKYNGEHIPGSPIQFHVDEIRPGQVSAFGSGLSHGVAGQQSNFTIVTKDAGAGGLALAVEGPSKAEITCRDNKDGTCSVSYLPTQPGEYNIIVKFADRHIPGSPFKAKIVGDQRKPQQVAVGAANEVSLKIAEQDLSLLQASIRSPSGHEEPCLLKRLSNGHIGISFTPREVGEHLVSVKKNGRHVANSPFKILVGQQEIGDARKVKVKGTGLRESATFDVAEFTVDTREAGYGGLGLSIEGPSKADINCRDNEDGTCTVTYRPTEPGNYIINIKFADQHVPGSPFTVKVTGEGAGKHTEKITRKRQAASVATVGSTCDLNLKIPANWFQMIQASKRIETVTRTEIKGGVHHHIRETRVVPGETSPFDLSAQVTSPSGRTEDAEIVELENCTYSVRFVPAEMGIHTVSVRYKGQHVPGSPFQFTVGPLTEGGAGKVQAGGPGLERGEVGQLSEFTIWTREAGAGGLAIAVEGPAKAEINFEDRKDGSCGVSYMPTDPGEYQVSIKFNDDHIPGSPFSVDVTPPMGDARQVSVSSLQETGLKLNQPASFAVQLNGARPGDLQAQVIAPSGAQEECIITDVEEAGQYVVRFMPRENGVYTVHVTYNGVPIPGSPFRIRAGSTLVEGDAGMVHAYGAGLEGGRTGERCEFIVNTINAGAGALAITVDGPSKVQLDCVECDEGYKVTYIPRAPGDYNISVKYAGQNPIVGSPFRARITGPKMAGAVSGVHESCSVVVETVSKSSAQASYAGGVQGMSRLLSDATKVKSQGMGLKKGFLGQKNSFNVDCGNAGTNMLMVGVHGPRTPCEEVNVKHMGGQKYNVVYTVREKGDYELIVKWGDQHIPGSPFKVTVT
ncbi:filamin-C-like isoform X5 [Branchiostoma floridae x Branchiostoma japonicum]